MNNTTQRYRQSINRAKARIASDWLRPWRLDELAEAAHVSPTHFHRMFSRVMGEPLADYLVRVRLIEARRRLMVTDCPIGVIALQVGYQDVSAFHRAFRRQFGMTPKTLRRLRHVVSHAALFQMTYANSKRRETMSITCDYVMRDAATIYCVTRKGMKDNTFSEAARSAFDALGAWLSEGHHWPAVREMLSYCPRPPAGPNDADADFVAAVSLGQPATAKGEIRVEKIDAGRFARFIHVGPYDTLWQTWNAIVRDWIPAHQNEMRMGHCFEVYVSDPKSTPPAELRTDIFISVKG